MYIVVSFISCVPLLFSLSFFLDCSSEVIVKYGLDFHVSLHDNSEPVRVGFPPQHRGG